MRWKASKEDDKPLSKNATAALRGVRQDVSLLISQVRSLAAAQRRLMSEFETHTQEHVPFVNIPGKTLIARGLCEEIGLARLKLLAFRDTDGLDALYRKEVLSLPPEDVSFVIRSEEAVRTLLKELKKQVIKPRSDKTEGEERLLSSLRGKSSLPEDGDA